jgi:hypothetical protein
LWFSSNYKVTMLNQRLIIKGWTGITKDLHDRTKRQKLVEDSNPQCLITKSVVSDQTDVYNKYIGFLWHNDLSFLYTTEINSISGVISELDFSAVDCVFKPRSGLTKDYKIDICCFSAKHAAP